MVTVIPYPVVDYMAKRKPTEFVDPEGNGPVPPGNTADDPLLYWGIKSLVHEIINPNKLVLVVCSYKAFVRTCVRFDPLNPHFSTFRPIGPTLLQESFTLNPPSVAAGAQAPLGTWTVNGASPGDRVQVGFSQDLQGMQLTGYVSAANTVKTVLRNGTAAAIDLASGTLFIDVWRAP